MSVIPGIRRMKRAEVLESVLSGKNLSRLLSMREDLYPANMTPGSTPLGTSFTNLIHPGSHPPQ